AGSTKCLSTKAPRSKPGATWSRAYAASTVAGSLRGTASTKNFWSSNSCASCTAANTFGQARSGVRTARVSATTAGCTCAGRWATGGCAAQAPSRRGSTNRNRRAGWRGMKGLQDAGPGDGRTGHAMEAARLPSGPGLGLHQRCACLHRIGLKLREERLESGVDRLLVPAQIVQAGDQALAVARQPRGDAGHGQVDVPALAVRAQPVVRGDARGQVLQPPGQARALRQQVLVEARGEVVQRFVRVPLPAARQQVVVIHVQGDAGIAAQP